MNLLEDVHLQEDTSDKWVWVEDLVVGYSAKKGYQVLQRLSIAEESQLVGSQLVFLGKLWKCWAPHKTRIFIWQVLRNCFPSKSNLLHRGMVSIVESGMCCFCNGQIENAEHLFLRCPFALQMWYEVAHWLNIPIVMPYSLWDSVYLFSGLFRGRKQWKLSLAIWVVCIWTLWTHRNSIVFSNGIPDAVVLTDSIKFRLWKWLQPHFPIGGIPLVSWCSNP